MTPKIVRGFLIGSSIGFFMIGLLSLGFFSSWQERASDSLFLPKRPNQDIVLIAIDDQSIQSIGRWPWDRTVHAQLLNKLATQPKVIALDITFAEPSNPKADQALADAIKTSSPVVLPIEAGSLQTDQETFIVDQALVPLPILQAVSRLGVVNVITDDDGVVRKVPATLEDTKRQKLVSFAMIIASTSREIKIGSTEAGTLRIPYVGPPQTFPVYSYKDVLDGTVKPETFANKIVIVGATANDLHDSHVTPVSHGIEMSGVEVHANAVSALLSGTTLHPESQRISQITILVLAIVSSIICMLLGIIPMTITTIILTFLYILYAFTSFDHGTIRLLILPIFTIIISFLSNIIYKYLSENRQRRFLRKAFSYYLSESVLQDILRDPKKLVLGGERKEITVLFSDIAGFTSISEKLAPEVLTKLLNEYLTEMTERVFATNGVLDKYIGDAVMAFWGAPVSQSDHAVRACHTALAMQEAITILKKDWQNFNVGELSVRIGINTGEMAVGNMGSTKRFDYTLIGDNVNLGSRLEGINKEYGTLIIISGATETQVKNQFVTRKLDCVAVKGKNVGVDIYELRATGAASKKESGFLDAFETARVLYEKGDFTQALANFETLAKSYPNDGPTKLYIERCRQLIADPPASWDGIFHAKTK